MDWIAPSHGGLDGTGAALALGCGGVGGGRAQRRRVSRGGGLALAILLAASASSPLYAQRASAWLPANHWSATVLKRLHAAGLIERDPALSPTLLETLNALPDPYRARLLAERSPGSAPGAFHVHVSALLSARRDALRPGGFTLEREWTGPTRIHDATSAGARLWLASSPLHWLAVTVQAVALEGDGGVEHATLDATKGALHVWGGRRAVSYDAGDGGGLVLNGLDRFDGAGLRTRRPVALPALGQISGEVFAGSLERNGHVEKPWLLGMRVHVRPHARLDIGATRVAVFGRTDGRGIGARAIGEVLLGTNLDGDHADDQVASMDFRWRPPLAAAMELHGEWGMHDIDFGVLFDVPAFTIGVRVPQLRNAASPGIGIEYTHIAESCCENPPWYHHFELADGWTRRGRLLGHPLGGHGNQWSATVSGEMRSARLVYRATGMLRRRGAENLFAPLRQGRAVAAEFGFDAALGNRAAVELQAFVERGAEWTESGSELAVRWRFH